MKPSSWLALVRFLRFRGRCPAWAVMGLVLWTGTSAMSGAEKVRRLQIVTSIPPIYCFAVNIAGDVADVENLLPAAVGPHDFQLSAKDMRRLSRADVVVLNGLSLEAWLAEAIESNRDRRSLAVVEAAAGLNQELIKVSPGSGPGRRKESGSPHSSLEDESLIVANPHIWLDPRLAIRAVRTIAAAFQKADPAHGDIYRQNSERYVRRLEGLDDELRRTLEPVREVPFVTHHDAFPYLVRRYGLRLVGVVERIPDTEPSPRELASLYRVVRDTKARVVFAEPQFSSKLVVQMARDLGLTVAELDPLETGRLAADAYEVGMGAVARTLREHLKDHGKSEPQPAR